MLVPPLVPPSLPSFPAGMNALVLSEEETTSAMAAGTSELKYLMAKEGVSERVQSLFYHVGCVTVARFGLFAANEEDLRLVLKNDMGLDSAASLKNRSEVSGVLVAFSQAGKRTEAVATHLGTLDATRQTKPLLGSDYLVMKNSYERTYGKLEDQDAPARVYLERRIAEMEAGELRAEALTMVLNREQDGEETLQPSWDQSGVIKLRKCFEVLDNPANPEELRRRLGVMITGLIMMARQHTNRKELQTITPGLLHLYAGYLLGDHVWMLIARDAEGLTVAVPQGQLVIKYELAIRKRAYSMMQDTGRPFEECLRESWLDPLTKERAFTTPLAISAATHRHVEMSTFTGENSGGGHKQKVSNKKTKQANKGKGGGKDAFALVSGKGTRKGGSKGKNKGGGLTVPAGCAPRTTEGRPICFGYNDKEVKCKNANCSFVHVCGICFQKHPMYVCKGNTGQVPSVAGETQGSGGR